MLKSQQVIGVVKNLRGGSGNIEMGWLTAIDIQAACRAWPVIWDVMGGVCWEVNYKSLRL